MTRIAVLYANARLPPHKKGGVWGYLYISGPNWTIVWGHVAAAGSARVALVSGGSDSADVCLLVIVHAILWAKI